MKFNDFMNKDKWRARTIILGFFLIISIGYMIYDNHKNNQDNINNLCNQIQGTPSWIDGYGRIVGSGYKSFGNESWNVVDELINQRIYFLYSSQCGWCKKQINYFGTSWKKYQKSGLTIDCSKIK